MNHFIALLFLLFAYALYPNQTPSLATTESLPSALVAGSVNVITGDHYVFEEELTIQGAFPLKIPRSYISGCGDKTLAGWQLFPHLSAGLYVDHPNRNQAYWRIVVKELNGSLLEFETETYVPRKDRPIILHLKPEMSCKGLTNVGRGVISGQTNLKNIRVELASNHKSFVVQGPDGTMRYYKEIKIGFGNGVPVDYLAGGWERIYLLQWEQLPNQSKICYGHDKHHRLSSIRTTTPDVGKTFASAIITYHSEELDKNRNFDIATSDGRVLSYRFEPHSNNFLLNSVSTPAYPQETMVYYDKTYDGGEFWGNLLKHRNVSSDRYYNLNYYWRGKNKVGKDKITIDYDDPRWLRVKTLSRPVGEGNAPLVTHRFYYDIHEHITSVREIDQTLTQYHYSKNFRINKISYFGSGDQLHHSEKYVWGEEGPLAANLLCHTFLDDQNKPIFSKRFLYDDRGNVQEEKLYGNLSGSCSTPLAFGKKGFPQDNHVETYVIKRSYSKDRAFPLKRFDSF